MIALNDGIMLDGTVALKMAVHLKDYRNRLENESKTYKTREEIDDVLLELSKKLDERFDPETGEFLEKSGEEQ